MTVVLLRPEVGRGQRWWRPADRWGSAPTAAAISSARVYQRPPASPGQRTQRKTRIATLILTAGWQQGGSCWARSRIRWTRRPCGGGGYCQQARVSTRSSVATQHSDALPSRRCQILTPLGGRERPFLSPLSGSQRARWLRQNSCRGPDFAGGLCHRIRHPDARHRAAIRTAKRTDRQLLPGLNPRTAPPTAVRATPAEPYSNGVQQPPGRARSSVVCWKLLDGAVLC